jgi:hypothetical protein
LYRQ